MVAIPNLGVKEKNYRRIDGGAIQEYPSKIFFSAPDRLYFFYHRILSTKSPFAA